MPMVSKRSASRHSLIDFGRSSQQIFWLTAKKQTQINKSRQNR